MSLLERLRGLGGKLGLVQVVPAKNVSDAPTKVISKTVTLDQLTVEVKEEEVRVLAQLPAELSVEFPKVYEAAGIKPPAHGWTVERLGELLRTEQYRAMDRDAAQRAVLGLLSAVKAQVEDLIKDAISRDLALDKFEAFVRQKMDDRIVARQRKITDIEEKIRGLEKEAAALAGETKGDEEHWQEWRKKKVAREQEMAWAIGYLVDKPVVTTDPVPPSNEKRS